MHGEHLLSADTPVLPVLQIYYLMKKMDEAGCDLFLDIHGDEEIPFNFLAGSEGIPSFNERLRDLQNTFSTAFVRASPDFQPKPGYTVDEPGKANLAISSNGVSYSHQILQSSAQYCVLPFKDSRWCATWICSSSTASAKCGLRLQLPFECVCVCVLLLCTKGCPFLQ